jgi:uncharacterized Zn finger protein
MPVYVQCPACSHPAIVSRFADGQRLRCRQCGHVFVLKPTRKVRPRLRETPGDTPSVTQR